MAYNNKNRRTDIYKVRNKAYSFKRFNKNGDPNESIEDIRDDIKVITKELELELKYIKSSKF